MNPYEALGVPPDATPEEVKRAFRKKARDTHPDRNSAPDAKERFQLVSTAYDVLSDPERRRRYDETGATEEEASRESKILMVIAGYVIQAIDAAGDVGATDIILQVRRRIDGEIAVVKDNRKAAMKVLTKRERAAKRLKKKSAGDNIIVKMVEAEVVKARAQIKAADEAVELAGDILKALEDYSYEVDPPEQFHQFTPGLIQIFPSPQ